MYSNLLEKINFERDTYLTYLLLISGADLIGRSYEITVKQAIYKKLQDGCKENRLPEDVQIKMLKTEDVIDYIFLQANTKGLIRLDGDIIPDQCWRRILFHIF